MELGLAHVAWFLALGAPLGSDGRLPLVDVSGRGSSPQGSGVSLCPLPVSSTSVSFLGKMLDLDTGRGKVENVLFIFQKSLC